MMRALKAIVIGMGIMIVMAVALIGYGLYKKSVDPGWKLFGKSVVISSPANNNAPLENFDNIELGLSNGCKITDVRPDGRRAYVLTGPFDICNGIIVIDIKDGRVIGHINN